MSIPLRRYVDIRSSVGASAGVATRNLGGRFFTGNPLVPTNSFVSFNSAADVGTYFGTSSVEYSRALFYFAWISKNNTSPNEMSFARYVNDNVAAEYLGIVGTYSLMTFTSISTGDFTLTLGGVTHHLTGIDLSAAASLDVVAADIQTAIRAYSAGGASWTAATVVYDSARGSFNLTSGVLGNDTIVLAAGVTTDLVTPLGWATGATLSNGSVPSTIYGKVATYAVSEFTGITTGDFTLTLGGFTHHLTGINLSSAANLSDVASDVQTSIRAYTAGGQAWTGGEVTYDSTRKSFNFVSGLPGTDVIALTAGVTTDLLPALGWATGAILSDGSNSQTTSEALAESSSASNNFGSFAFIPTLTIAQITEAAQWNAALDITFLYSVPVTAANATAWNAALIGIGGVTLTLSPLSNEYPEQAPMMIESATNYNGTNSVQSYMFQQFALTASVTSEEDANIYDGLRINYYGQTQQSGQLISFYQRGLMFGLPTSPADQNVYVNEIWLKDAASSAIMTLLLALSQLPANAQGRSQILAILQGVINQAVINGTISVGKPLTETQKAFITQTTGDSNAWQQVMNLGYWVDVAIEDYVESGVTKYKAVYTLIYSKDDVIRLVTGADILI